MLRLATPTARVLAIVLAGLAIAGAAVGGQVAVGGLRDRADAQLRGVAAVASVRSQIADVNALVWQSVSLRTPNFTVRRAIGARGPALRAGVRRLRATPDHREGLDLGRGMGGYLATADRVERLLVAGRVDAATDAANQSLRTSSRLLAAELARESRAMRTEAARLSSRAERLGRLVILGGGAVALVLLALVGLSERRRRTAQQRSTRRFRSLVEKASDGVLLLDEAGHVVEATRPATRMLGRGSLVGRRFSDLVAGTDLQRVQAALDDVRAGRAGPDLTAWSVVQPDGSTRQVESSLTDLRDDPAVGAVVVNLHDVTERGRLEHELRHQAFHDALTGLPNRALFEDRAERALTRRRRSGVHVGLLLVDVDDFKAINDGAGHPEGDRVLRRMAAGLDGAVRATDTVARLGGDEFAVLLEDPDSTASVAAMAERVLDALRELTAADGRPFTVSIGAVVAEAADATGDALLRDADIALYEAKASGKGRAAVFGGAMLDDARRRLRIRTELAGAAGRGELDVHYQPIVALDRRELVGVEALVRWHHPELGTIPPAEFIPLAEETGDVLDVGRFVVERACRDLAAWSADGLVGDIPVSVNVSARQLADGDVLDLVLGSLHAHGLGVGRLVVELTESTMVQDVELAGARVRALRAAGIRVAIDDFGTGYSSLSYLGELELDLVKIDRSFVARVDQGRGATLVRSIIELSRELGLRPVAEGIERTSQLDALRALDCDLGQGYLFARPAAEAEVRRRLEAGDPAGV